MKPNGVPETEAEADALRAYLPSDTLANLAKIRDEEIAESDVRRRKWEENRATYDAIKERMRRDRIALKKAEAASREYFATPLFPRTDAARDAAWIEAAQARRQAIARGEAPRFETCKECGDRQKAAAKIYTP